MEIIIEFSISDKLEFFIIFVNICEYHKAISLEGKLANAHTEILYLE